MVDAISPSENTNSEEVSASIEGQYTPWSEAHLKERVLRAEQEAFRLQPLQERAQANKNSLEKQVDTLSIREQEEIWRGIFASPEVQNSYPLLKQLGIIDLTLQQAPMDPKGKVRTASKLKFWDNSYRTNEQNFVSLIEEKLGIRIEHNPIIKSMGIVSQSGNEIYMQYSRSMPSIRDRLLAFGEHGLIDVWTSMIGHEFVHVRKRQTILKDREAILAKLQDKAQFDKHRGEDEANALLSDPAYIMYDLLPAELRHVEKIEDYVNDICYETVSHIPKAEFAEAIPQIMALRAIGVDPLEISTVVGQAGSLTELLAQKKKEKGITDTGVTLAIQAMKLELNNDRLKIMVETQRLIEEAGEMHAIRTRLAA